jgi:hypothetical protein
VTDNLNVDHVAEAKRELVEGNAMASMAHSLIALAEYGVVPQKWLTSWHDMTEQDLAKASGACNITVDAGADAAADIADRILRRRIDTQLH